MKRKIIIVIIVMIMPVIIFVLKQENTLGQLVEITEVYLGNFEEIVRTVAVVDGKGHEIYFPGNIIERVKDKNDYVQKGEKIAVCQDIYGKRKNVTSPVDGYVEEISAASALIREKEVFLRCEVELTVRNELKCGSEHLFTSQGMHYLARIRSISSFGQRVNGRLCFEIILDVENPESLYHQQTGELVLELGTRKDVLLVDRKALMKDESGYFLLERGYIDDPGNPEKYRRNIEIVAVDDGKAWIRGLMLENMEVCVLSKELKEILDDQA